MADAVACRALLPDAFPAVGRVPELLLARMDGVLAGAAAVAWVPGGFPVLLQVHTQFRRLGVGRALLDAAIVSARGETGAVRSWTTVAAGSAAAGLLGTCGFVPVRRFLWFETDAAQFEAEMTGLLRRVAPRVPSRARVVPLRDAPRDGVVGLVSAGLSTLPHDVALRLVPGARNGFDLGLSLAVMLDGTVVGAMLCQVDGDALRVEVNVVAPDMRGRWVNLMLVEAMARQARAAGTRRFRFGCEPHVTDTLGLARRTGATAMADQLDMWRSLRAG